MKKFRFSQSCFRNISNSYTDGDLKEYEIILKYYYNVAYVCLSGIISKYCRTVQRCFYRMNICTTVHVYILPGIITAEQYNVASTG